ncbi:MAG: hypothetical protein Q7S13_05545 [Candidatus Omnitrophota bacterium]|nr:hypothetical protein [Candidatus Omnitrophota bacterium]
MNRQAIISVFLVVMFLSIWGLNAFISQNINKVEEGLFVNTTRRPQAIPAKPSQAPGIISEEQFREKFAPADPDQYGFTVLSEHQTPDTQEEWDKQMAKIIKEQQVFDDPEGQKALEAVQESPESFNQKMSQVDKDIARFQKLHDQDPYDKDVNRRLEILYRIKSLGNALHDKAVK